MKGATTIRPQSPILDRFFPALQGEAFPPSVGLPLVQDDSSLVGSAPDEDWLENLRSAGEKFEALQAMLDEAQGPAVPTDGIGPEDPRLAGSQGLQNGPRPVPGWGIALAGLGDLILGGQDDDYDPFTELPATPHPSFLDRVSLQNRAAQDYAVDERRLQEKRGDNAREERSRERNVLLGSMLPYILGNRGGKETDAEKIQGRIRLLQEMYPGYDELEPEEQRRVIMEMFPGANAGNAPKTLDQIRTEAEARSQGTWAGRPETPKKPVKDPIADAERALHTRLFQQYVTKGEGGVMSVPLAPEEANKRATAAVEVWRQSNGREAGRPIGYTNQAPTGGGGDNRDFDTDGHLFEGPNGEILYPGDEGYDEAAAAADADLDDEDEGGMDMARIMADPRLSSALGTIQGTRGFPPQPTAAMGGFGDLLARQPGDMPGVIGGGSTAAPPRDLLKGLAGFRIAVNREPQREAELRLKFYNRYGVDPYEATEQAPGVGR